MKREELVIKYSEYSNKEELPQTESKLLEEARKAAMGAYAPYSGFKVGAALLLDNGEIISASNQENAAYPSGLCAERVAIFYAHARYPNAKVLELAVTAFFNGKELESPTYPCGACRQVIAESEQRGKNPIRIIIGSKGVTQVVESTSALLPFVFDNLPR
ncbi:MAG: cytidine deaminase [Bacteroidales bacterium]|jgi:cytidine deaminase|nr:cytidine deaminase [Bacteroidales bacterium]